MEGHEWGQQQVKQRLQRAVVWSLPTAAHSSPPLPCTLSGVTPALSALHTTLSRLRTACLLWTLWYVEGCSGKEAGGATHHCVSGFITWSLMGVFLPHLGPTFWDFLSTYDNLTHSGYKGNVTQEKELWTQSQKQDHFPAMWRGQPLWLSFLICKKT